MQEIPAEAAVKRNFPFKEFEFHSRPPGRNIYEVFIESEIVKPQLVTWRIRAPGGVMGDFDINTPVRPTNTMQLFHKFGKIVEMFQDMMTDDFGEPVILKGQRSLVQIMDDIRLVFRVDVQRHRVMRRFACAAQDKFRLLQLNINVFHDL